MKILCVLTAMFLACCAIASAEYYKYVDENGVLHFTDNLLEVPQDQRETLQKFKEIKTAPPGEDLPNKDAAGIQTTDEIKKKADYAEKTTPTGDTATLSKLQELNREKAVLDQEYEYLVRKKQGLKAERQKVSGKEAAEAYNTKISALNDEIRNFESRRQVYLEKVKAFNASQ